MKYRGNIFLILVLYEELMLCWTIELNDDITYTMSPILIKKNNLVFDV